MSIFTEGPISRTISFSFERMGLSIDSRFYASHPEGVKNAIDQIARGVLDPDSGHVLVTGLQSVGKTFIIEQFASNVDQYLTNTNLDFLHTIKISRSDSILAEQLPNGIQAYIETCSEAYKCELENLCFVTESVDFAAAIYAFSPAIKIILELNISTFAHLNNREQQGASKIWSSWDILNVNELYLTFEELESTLLNTMVPKLKEAKLGDLSHGEVTDFIEAAIEDFPEIVYQRTEDSDDYSFNESMEGFILLPPGLWGLAIRKLATNMAFSSNKELFDEAGNIDIDKLIHATLQEVNVEFGTFLDSITEEEESASNISFFPPGLEESMVKIFHIGNGQDEVEEAKADEVKTPFVFNKFSTLEKRIEKSVLGQSAAVTSVVSALSVPAAGIHDEEKPLRTFLFLGPTGVGKTQLALSLAENVMKEPMNTIRLDMSEYSQAHEASKLLGAPSGYVGYEEGGILTSAVLKHPKSLILLDEVEKAHFKIWDSFLQIFDAGRMTDNKGRIIDFSQCIIIMTSNLGSKEASQRGGAGFFNGVNASANARQAVTSKVEEFFRPEFINRIDEMIFFDPLSIETARAIVRREIVIVSDRMKPKGFKLSSFEDNVVDEIIKLSAFTKYGARDIQRAVFKSVSQPLAMRILAKEDKKKTIRLSMNTDNEIQIN